ncbi:hypothetical protein CPT32_30515 [Rhizobium sophoriradicis]|nr:hypothetical protein CPT32_30515 [Rhizobium sophoriradicis]PDS72421.1 hypothetical protein CO667_33485 [Rhizobium sp. L43]
MIQKKREQLVLLADGWSAVQSFAQESIASNMAPAFLAESNNLPILVVALDALAGVCAIQCAGCAVRGRL